MDLYYVDIINIPVQFCRMNYTLNRADKTQVE